MAAQSRRTRIANFLLALAMLIASVGAPFRPHALGRAFLYGSDHASPFHGVVRVRAVSSGGLTQGFRAVVGVSTGGEHAAAGARSSVRWHRPNTSADSFPTSADAHPSARPNPPLRC